MKQVILLILLALLYPTIFAQEVLLEKEVNDSSFHHREGPNQKKFDHLYFGLGIVPGEFPGNISSRITNSYLLDVGYRYKLKVNSFYALGFALGYHKYIYSLDRNLDFIVYSSGVKKERISLDYLYGEGYQRINFGKRGNTVGTFLDVGINFSWNAKSKHTWQATDNDDVLAGKKVVENSRLKYIERFGAEIIARFGINRYVLFTNYRIVSLMKDEFAGEAEFPEISIGIQIGIHK